ncbi:enoyl-CoA hydratase/isomerase family protein [Pseudonocardia endophytica]|uniref:Enoyl-CoA hydratase/carnithine racemase n=1 Tax=Pseudonocardia endophytica TaxID=401976 RepID=A0A4R1HXX3_PSEEN|nr:enoyl-CoA hydratase-related protein [Pseudonocardia endophytica]TCK26351.1 enoyl-CoA hydratase/carnithine racemase [Pseudonocardia endophytica]
MSDRHGPAPAPTTLHLTEHPGGVVVLTLNRPDRANAMTATMFDELADVAHLLERRDDARVLVVTGAGRAFCAGYDLADAERLPELGAVGMLDLQERAARALLALRSVRVPVVAAVNGAAAGGGMALALAADIRIGSPNARFVASFVTIGLSAGDLGTSWLLPRLIGPAAAAELVFTGRTMSADEAERRGLLNRIVPADQLLPTVRELAGQICRNSPAGVRMSKRAMHANLEIGSYAAALELENRGQAVLSRTRDMSEALDAFRAGREPVFRGE